MRKNGAWMDGELNLRLTNRGLLLLLAALGFVWLLGHATHIFVVLFLAVLLAAAVSTTANRLARYRVKRAVAILLTYLVIIAALVGIVALVVPLLTGEARLLRDNLPMYTERLNDALTRLPHPGGAALQVADLTARLGDYAQAAVAGLGRGVLDAGSVLVTTLLVFVIAFFLAVDERFAQLVITRFLPAAHRARAGALLGRIGDSLGAWVRAQLLVGLFFGVAFALGLALLRVPYAFTIGVVGAVLEIIPYIGGLITILLALLVAATTGQLWLVAAVLLWYVLVVNIESHVVYPKLVGEIVGLHPLVVVIALFLGAETLGILGALLAVPLAVLVQALLDEFYRVDGPGAGAHGPNPEHAAGLTVPPGLPLQPGGLPTHAGTGRSN